MDKPEIIIVPAMFVMIGYVVWVTVTASLRRHRLKLVTEFNSRLLERIGSVKDFSEFLNTDAGSRFLRDLVAEPSATGPKDRILRAAQLGTVLICLGFGLLGLSFFWSPLAPDEGQTVFVTIGTIALSLGIGFAISAAASFRLAGTLGLLNAAPSRRLAEDARS